MKRKTVVAVIAFTVLWSMAVHASVPHDHAPRIFGDGVQAYMHGEDRKLWQLLLALGVILFSATARFSLFAFRTETFRFTMPAAGEHAARSEPLRIFFSRGIVHPKLCG